MEIGIISVHWFSHSQIKKKHIFRGNRNYKLLTQTFLIPNFLQQQVSGWNLLVLRCCALWHRVIERERERQWVSDNVTKICMRILGKLNLVTMPTELAESLSREFLWCDPEMLIGPSVSHKVIGFGNSIDFCCLTRCIHTNIYIVNLCTELKHLLFTGSKRTILLHL